MNIQTDMVGVGGRERRWAVAAPGRGRGSSSGSALVQEGADNLKKETGTGRKEEGGSGGRGWRSAEAVLDVCMHREKAC
jgi:hypothetical protein